MSPDVSGHCGFFASLLCKERVILQHYNRFEQRFYPASKGNNRGENILRLIQKMMNQFLSIQLSTTAAFASFL